MTDARFNHLNASPVQPFLDVVLKLLTNVRSVASPRDLFFVGPLLGGIEPGGFTNAGRTVALTLLVPGVDLAVYGLGSDTVVW